jgi:AcrR family transcriptional regulator
MDQQNTRDRDTAAVEPMQPKLGLRERKKRLRLQRIIDVSHRLFVSKGFQDTTIQDIADEAGIGLGTLYLYAKGKDDLLVLVFREDLLQMTESAFDIIDPKYPVIDQLMTFFSVHIDYHKEDQLLSRTVLKELSFPTNPKRRHDIELIFNTAYEKLAVLLKRGIKDGKLNSTLYVGTAASSIFGLYYHLLQGFLCGFFSEKEFKKNLRHALDMLLSSANSDA